MPRERPDRDAASLLDISVAASRITEAIRGAMAEQYAGDWRLQSIVLHQLLVPGEAAKRVSVRFASANPRIPWSEMARTRDRLIHGYDDIDPAETWRIITADIPALLKEIAPLLPPREAP